MSLQGATSPDVADTSRELASISFNNATNYGAQIAQNLGTVNLVNNFGEQHETRLTPSLFLPFSRDHQFVNRPALIGQILDKCFMQTYWTAIVGLGGVGKSQLAIECSYQIREQSPNTWVFWIYASNIVRFEQSLRDIAEVVNIPDRKDPQADIFRLIQGWLRDAKNGSWVLILDNLDDAKFLTTRVSPFSSEQTNPIVEQSQILLNYIPHTSHGSVLITTRNKGVAVELVDKCNIIEVGPMEKEQGVALLNSKLGNCGAYEENQVTSLATNLEFMPLAMVQAASYISNLRYSIQQYLESYRKSDRKREQLLSYNQDLGYLRRDSEAQNVVSLTWQISFDHVHQMRRSAADLLSLMSFFDRQGIPASLLRYSSTRTLNSEQRADSDAGEDDISDSASDDDVEFRQDIRTLENFSFISVNHDATIITMHSLVQFATRKWLQDQRQLRPWRQQCIKNLSVASASADYHDWAQLQALIPHIKSVISQKPEKDQWTPEWFIVVFFAARYFRLKEDAADAEEMSLKATEIAERVFGPDHEHTLTAINFTGRALTTGGRYGKAEEVHRNVIEKCKSILGADHPRTLVCMNDLASIYVKQGRQGEAEQIYKQVFIGMRSKMGASHVNTLSCASNLALVYQRQGRLHEAEYLYKQVVKDMEMNLGASHSQTLLCMNNLSLVYQEQGRLDEAQQLQIRLLDTNRERRGPDHPDTIRSMTTLGSTYLDTGPLEEAEKLYTQVFDLRKKKHGLEHPLTLFIANNLALLYQRQSRLEDAESLFIQVLGIGRRKLGLGSQEMQSIMSNLAHFWEETGRISEAITLLEECNGLQLQMLGADHPETRKSSLTLAEWRTRQPQAEMAHEGDNPN